MTLLAHYRMFGHYNAWANARLYDAAARLGSEQYRADRGAFFNRSTARSIISWRLTGSGCSVSPARA